jgi:polyhydroxyalkanoate synthesis regulator phasin
MAMLELLKKGMYIGLGLAALTKDRLESVVKEVAKSAQLSEEEGRKLAKELEEESGKARESLKAMVDKMVESAVAKLPCVRKVEEMEKRLAALESAAKPQA